MNRRVGQLYGRIRKHAEMNDHYSRNPLAVAPRPCIIRLTVLIACASSCGGKLQGTEWVWQKSICGDSVTTSNELSQRLIIDGSGATLMQRAGDCEVDITSIATTADGENMALDARGASTFCRPSRCSARYHYQIGAEPGGDDSVFGAPPADEASQTGELDCPSGSSSSIVTPTDSLDGLVPATVSGDQLVLGLPDPPGCHDVYRRN